MIKKTNQAAATNNTPHTQKSKAVLSPTTTTQKKKKGPAILSPAHVNPYAKIRKSYSSRFRPATTQSSTHVTKVSERPEQSG